MDKADRIRYRQLANDAVIATFGESGLTAQLAEALEKCVDDIDYHGDCHHGPQVEPEGAILNLDTVQAIHDQLEERLTDFERVVATADDMLDSLKETLKDMKQDVKELGDEL